MVSGSYNGGEASYASKVFSGCNLDKSDAVNSFSRGQMLQLLTGSLICSPKAALNVRQAITSAANKVHSHIVLLARRFRCEDVLVEKNAFTSVPAASIAKLLVAIATLEDSTTLKDGLSSKVIATGPAVNAAGETNSEFVPGHSYSLARLLDSMIRQSNNAAANILISVLGGRHIKEVAQQLNLSNTNIGSTFSSLSGSPALHFFTSGVDVNSMLTVILRRSKDARDPLRQQNYLFLLDSMLRQEDRRLIPGGLPCRLAIANKTGEISGTLNDAAIVGPFDRNPIIVTILVSNILNYEQTINCMNEIAYQVYVALRTESFI